ncbi:DUF937 domain-containing protein [Leptolyngbya sp. 7M]|uniref:DUF937 domain-containing protein n=1 Tax=Leptolyngbya sp. 7M TaxID=2812896 RepID=UPI001B8A9E0A|nr:DUF937 domain-containing protein [Leptolyngbya sp. 7M]QYO62002.1 DUF937 domain-containing protein [Leptolyngbya sp. 7M]
MGLFFDVLSAINNPNQNASVDQLSSITGTVQQLAASNNIEPSAMQTVMSSLGGALRPALQQQASSGGLGSLMGQLASGQLTGGTSSFGGLSSLLTPQLQQQIADAVSRRTGIGAGTIQSMLPALIPVVMQLLNMGAPKSGTGMSMGGLASNPLLTTFLDSDRDQDVDLGDVFRFATRFLNPPR